MLHGSIVVCGRGRGRDANAIELDLALIGEDQEAILIVLVSLEPVIGTPEDLEVEIGSEL